MSLDRHFIPTSELRIFTEVPEWALETGSPTANLLIPGRKSKFQCSDALSAPFSG